MKKAHLIIMSLSVSLGLNACLPNSTSDWLEVRSISPATFNGDDGPKLVRVTLLNEETIQYEHPVIRADSLISDRGVGRSVSLSDILLIEAWDGDHAPETDYEDEEDFWGFPKTIGLAFLGSLLIGALGF